MSGSPGHESARESVVLPDGSPLTADAFYAQRDARTTISTPLPLDPIQVVIALPPWNSETDGGHTALLWTCSMLRRMGRSFAGIRIASNPAARIHPYRGALLRALGGITLEE